MYGHSLLIAFGFTLKYEASHQLRVRMEGIVGGLTKERHFEEREKNEWIETMYSCSKCFALINSLILTIALCSKN